VFRTIVHVIVLATWWNTRALAELTQSGLDYHVDETPAKAIYSNGFTLGRLRMVEVNDSAVSC
jgi:hypothetical protein